jgi:hypothetical protein
MNRLPTGNRACIRAWHSCFVRRQRAPVMTSGRTPARHAPGLTAFRRYSAGVAMTLAVCSWPLPSRSHRLAAQQVADTAFRPDVGPPRWTPGEGPHVVLDEAHHNFHTLEGRYLTFGRLLRHDGFVVTSGREPFSSEGLTGTDILVVANALAAENASEDDWKLPSPSAFTSDEIAAVRAWVEGGGALLLIADHMPFPGAAHELAAAFGFDLLNSFALNGGVGYPGPPIVFRHSDGTLPASPATRGRGPEDVVDSVASFTGEAFRAPAGADPVLVLPRGTRALLPDTSWAFHDDTPQVDVSGWSQGATVEVGRGRVAVFGEAAMFSAQVAGPDRKPMGMNAPVASQNARLLLNLMRWLAGAGR